MFINDVVEIRLEAINSSSGFFWGCSFFFIEYWSLKDSDLQDMLPELSPFIFVIKFGDRKVPVTRFPTGLWLVKTGKLNWEEFSLLSFSKMFVCLWEYSEDATPAPKVIHLLARLYARLSLYFSNRQEWLVFEPTLTFSTKFLYWSDSWTFLSSWSVKIAC